MSHQPKGSMCAACANCGNDCSGKDFASMQPIKVYADGVKAMKCEDFDHATAAPDPCAPIIAKADKVYAQNVRLRASIAEALEHVEKAAYAVRNKYPGAVQHLEDARLSLTPKTD